MKDQSRRVFGSELILLSTLGLLCAVPLRNGDSPRRKLTIQSRHGYRMRCTCHRTFLRAWGCGTSPSPRIELRPKLHALTQPCAILECCCTQSGSVMPCVEPRSGALQSQNWMISTCWSRLTGPGYFGWFLFPLETWISPRQWFRTAFCGPIRHGQVSAVIAAWVPGYVQSP